MTGSQRDPASREGGGRGRHPRTGRPGWRRRIATVAGASLAATLLAACGGDDGGVPVINLYGGVSQAGFTDIIASCNEEAEGRYRIVPNLTPSDADGQREQFVRRLAAEDDGMDLLGMDVTWTAEFAEAGWIRELTGEQRQQAEEDAIGPALETAKWQDKLYAIPKHTNVQLLFYRKSLVPDPPTTWDDVLQRAEELKQEGKPHVVSITAAQYEGLVVNFNTILSSLGGTLVNEDSTEATVDETTTQTLEMLSDFARSDVSSASLSNSQEPEVFAQLQTEEAAFALNWPYTYGSMKEANPEVYEDLAWTKIPEFKEGEPGRATLGGMNFAISTFSKHPDEAFDAAMCLRSPENQIIHAQNGNEPPTVQSAYDDPGLREAYPMWEDLLAELKTASTRPVTPLYQNISTIVSSTLSPPRDIDPEDTTEQLESAITDAIEGRGILP